MTSTVSGSASDDTLVSTSADETIDGGSGSDTVSYDSAPSGVTVDLRLSGPQPTGGGGVDTLISIEGVIGSSYDDVITGSDGGQVSLVSSSASGALGNGISFKPEFSPDGSKVLFSSDANNLVANDSSAYQPLGSTDIFIKDLATGAITRVSTDANGVGGNGSSTNGVFSPDGTKVAFESYATNLVPGDNNNSIGGAIDVFVKDLTTGAISLVSVSASGAQGDGDSITAQFSPDGSKIIFSSYADDFVTGDTNSAYDIFSKDLNTGAVTRLSTASDGRQANDGSYAPLLSADGSKLLFHSSASNLVAGDTNGVWDVFVKDLNTGAVTRVSTDADGGQADGLSYGAVFSPDGTKVAFISDADNLVPGDTNGTYDVFVKDLTTGAITLISTNADRVQGNDQSADPVFSPDGEHVAFISNATNLVSGDANGTWDIFIKDLKTGEVTRASVGQSGAELNDQSYFAAYSADGAELAFTSLATNAITGDTNGVGDVFVNDVSGRDHLSGGAGNDQIYGLSGNDVLDGGPGDDLLDGGASVNTASYADAPAGVTVSLAISGPQDTQGAGVDTLVNIQNLVGSSLSDHLAGDGDPNALQGGGGDDTLTGGAGNDVIDGGAGVDTAVFSGDYASYTLTSSSGSVQVEGPDGRDTLTSIEILRFADRQLANSDAGTTLTARAGGDTLIGAGGDDQLVTSTGIETLDGGGGADTAVFSGAYADYAISEGASTTVTGDNLAASLTHVEILQFSDLQMALGTQGQTLTARAGGDILVGTSGADTMLGGAGDDRLIGNGGADAIDGAGGVDIAVFANAFATYQFSQSGGTTTVSDTSGATTLTHVEVVEFGDRQMVLGAQGQTLAARASGDTLVGGAGADTLNGAAGNDTFIGGGGGDTIDGGGGANTAVFAGDFNSYHLSQTAGSTTVKTDAVTSTLTHVQVVQFDDAQMILGSVGGALTARSNGDTLFGGGGADTLSGAAGDDIVVGGGGADVIDGGAGHNTAVSPAPMPPTTSHNQAALRLFPDPMASPR